MKNNKVFPVGALLVGAVLVGVYSFGLFNSKETSTQADGWREQIVPNISLRLQK